MAENWKTIGGIATLILILTIGVYTFQVTGKSDICMKNGTKEAWIPTALPYRYYCSIENKTEWCYNLTTYGIPNSKCLLLKLINYSSPTLEGSLTKFDFAYMTENHPDLVTSWTEYHLCKPKKILDSDLENFRFSFKIEKGVLESFHLEISEEKSQIINDYETLCYPYNETIEYINGTQILKYSNCTQILVGNHTEYYFEWKERTETEFINTFKNLSTGKCVEIRVIGKREPLPGIGYLGEFAVENVLTFAGFEYPEYNWWNYSWVKRRNLTFSQTYATNRSEGYSGVINNLTVSNCTKEIRLTDSVDIEVPSYARHINTTACEIYFKLTMNDTSNKMYYIYYNNSGATKPTYSTNLSLSGKVITNKNWNASINESEGHGTVLKLKAENFNANNTLVWGMYPGITGDVYIYNYTVLINDPVIIKVGFNNTVKGLYNITFFHDTNFWKYNSFNTFANGSSGIVGQLGFGGGIDKCIDYRTGESAYTENCGEIANGELVIARYFDFSRSADTVSYFAMYKNVTGTNITTNSMYIYLRDGDTADPQFSIPASGYYTAAGDVSNWLYIWEGIINKSNTAREDMFNALYYPPTATLGAEETPLLAGVLRQFATMVNISSTFIGWNITIIIFNNNTISRNWTINPDSNFCPSYTTGDIPSLGFYEKTCGKNYTRGASDANITVLAPNSSTYMLIYGNNLTLINPGIVGGAVAACNIIFEEECEV